MILPILMILPFCPFCSTCSLNLFSPHTWIVLFAFSVFAHSFFYSISSFRPLLGLSWMNRNSGYRPHPFLTAPVTFRQISGFNRQQRFHLCLICQSELLSTPAHTVPSIPTSMPASMSLPSSALVNHGFQQQREQGGSSSSFHF